MTATAWTETVAWTKEDSAQQVPQDESGRLWDVLWMSYVAARKAGDGCRVPVQLYVVPRDGHSSRARLTTLHMAIGPGDSGEPTITLMKPHED